MGKKENKRPRFHRRELRFRRENPNEYLGRRPLLEINGFFLTQGEIERLVAMMPVLDQPANDGGQNQNINREPEEIPIPQIVNQPLNVNDNINDNGQNDDN